MPPVLQTWKTSVGFSLLGLFVGFPAFLTIVMILTTLLATLLCLFVIFVAGETVGLNLAHILMPPSSTPQPLLIITGNLLMLIYALRVYPSYFTDKLVFKSSKVISFANFTFGNWVGVLWNINLAKKKKGVSYIITAIGSGLVVTQFLFGIIIAVVMLFSSTSATTTSTSQNYDTGASGIERPADMGVAVPLSIAHIFFGQPEYELKSNFYNSNNYTEQDINLAIAQGPQPAIRVGMRYLTGKMYNQLTSDNPDDWPEVVDSHGIESYLFDNGEIISVKLFPDVSDQKNIVEVMTMPDGNLIPLDEFNNWRMNQANKGFGGLNNVRPEDPVTALWNNKRDIRDWLANDSLGFLSQGMAPPAPGMIPYYTLMAEAKTLEGEP
jgi:hypothetical protein